VKELHERAKRHGLHREEEVVRWANERGQTLVWQRWEGDPNCWAWSSPNGPYSDSQPHYKTEATALRAALDWLDEQRPDRAWRQSPGSALAEAVGDLNFVCGRLWLLNSESVKGIAGDLERAILKVEALALPPASDEGEVLQVGVDFLLTRGGLTGSAREALVRAVRHDPGVVADAQLAVWVFDRDGDWMLHPMHPTGLQVGAWIGWVEGVGGEWRWSAHPPDSDAHPQGEEDSPEAAREACARALPEWRVLEAPARPAETALEIYEVSCAQCGGEGIEGGCETCGSWPDGPVSRDAEERAP